MKLDVEPRVTLDDYVNIKIGLEVSSLGEKTITKNGATVYTIGTRNANTALRLKNGETQVLAGLILDDERKNASKLPGLGDIPLLGRLFANQEDKKSKTEIVLAITPRIIGNIRLPEAEVAEYWSGTENLITNKPLLNLPVTATSLSPQDKLKEQIRVRQSQTNAELVTPDASQEAQSVQPPAINPAEASQSHNVPEASPSALPQQGESQDLPPPAIDPSNPPLAP